MNPPHQTPTRPHELALPLAVLGLAAWNSLPTLVEAWQCDLYAKGAPLAIAIWLAPQVWLVIKGRPSPYHPCIAWLAASLLLGTAGSMTGLRVLHHLALALAVPGALGLRTSGLLVIAAAPAWLPATGWFVSHWKASGLAGWERPVYSLVLAILLLAFSRRIPKDTHINHSDS